MSQKATMTKIRCLITRFEKQANCHCGHKELIHKMWDTRFALEELIESAIKNAYFEGINHGRSVQHGEHSKN